MLLASRILFVVMVTAAVLARPAAPPVHAAGTETKPAEDSASELYNQGLELAENGDYAAARKKFEKAHAEDTEDADILNMLAFTMRKTGDLEKAFETYEKALAQRDRFPQAREYLAEAHVQAVLDQVTVLRSYGEEGADQLAAIAEELRRALAEVAAHVPASAKPGRKW